MRTLAMAWRLLRRDLAAGEVRVLLAALLLAVTVVTAVGFITDRAERALALQANRLLGGDAALRADTAIGAAPRALAQRLGLRSTEVWSFPSMLRHGEQWQLAEIRALDQGYPLRGHYRLLGADQVSEVAASTIPAPGTAWLTRAGAQALGLGVGDALKIGYRPLRVAALVAQEPDAALDYFNVAPRLFVNLQDLPATGLIQPGSRISYRFVVAGEAGAVARFAEATRRHLGRGQRLETIDDARPELRSALDRADRFLGLAALLSVVLAAIAVAMAARRHAARHLDSCAVMRCLGASQRHIATIYLAELGWLGVIASVVGVGLAFVLQSLFGHGLARLLGLAIPPPGWLPVVAGFAVGVIVLITFALPPVLALRRVSALRVLRRDLAVVEPSAWLLGLTGLSGLAALLWWKAGSAVLASALLIGIVGTLLVLAAMAALLVWSLRRLRQHLRGPWRYGLANVGRRALASAAQIAALGLGLMVILLLTLVRTDLLDRWQRAIPADAPNRFIVNVQPEQVPLVRDFLRIGGVRAPVLYPMVRARLLEVNGQTVSAADYAANGERAERVVEREFNLSSSASYRPADNQIVAGQWWPETGPTRDEISVEQGLAAALGWRLGDRVAFAIAGQRFEARISSLRKVDWESFQPNFFVVAAPGALADYAASYLTALRLPSANPQLANQLLAKFPNLTVIDVDAVLKQVRATADQVAIVVEGVFYFTLVAGLLVLLAAVSATQDERLLEGAVMRALGASTRQLRCGHAAEFIAIGGLAGLTAAIAATLLSGVIAERVFNLPWSPDWRLAALAAGLGTLLVTVTGLLATRRVQRTPPSSLLRGLC
ncbi:MAG: permease [Lysobacterales bacterium CG02_land_8_20_14_3_00_62_12]|nr:MAG: permease [Xanthomonadales bacterium CG02_land_8_20_14_3_00_62_12]